MNAQWVDALLLLVFSIPIVTHYRLLPISGTPYWLFTVLFMLLLGNVIFSFFPSVIRFRMFNRIKNILLLLVLVIVLGGTMGTAIADRSKTAPVYGVHDIILQQEAAMRYLLQGKNPYKETYFGTPLESWHYDELGHPAVNPALYHFVMPPWYLIFPFGFYFLSLPVLGFFDGRIPLLLVIFALLYILMRWFRDKRIARIAVVLTVLSPAAIDYIIEGRSDMFALFWFVIALFFLEKKKYAVSGVLTGLALMSKQTIWFAFPFFVCYAWQSGKQSMRIFARFFIPLGVVVLCIAGPFVLWDTRAFFDSVIFYLSGNTANAYPISGYGLGMLLVSFGIIKNTHDYFPFIIWQLIFGIPVMLAALRFLDKRKTTGVFLFGYALTLFVFWYMSRYFNNSHLGFLSNIFTLSFLKAHDEGMI